MAKGANIGFLNFGISGDDTEMMKTLKKIKDESKSIEQIFKDIKLNTDGNSISTDVQKAAIAADKLAKSQNEVTRSAVNVLKAEQQLETAITNENNAKAKGLVIEGQRQTALQRSLLYAKQGEAVSAESVRKEAMAKQKLLIEEEKLIGLRKRNAQIGVQGQHDLASAYGLTNKTMFSQQNMLMQLSSALGVYFSITQVGSFIKELANVSGEFEKQRVSLAAIIGDAGAASKIFNQLKDLAVISPFNFKELTDYAKQLSAFSIPTNEIYDTTKRLADLSAGLGVDMNRIILAYGQVRSAAVLRGQELRQFTEAGIPLVDELAKKFGELEGRVVSAGEVFDKISNREASFGMVKEIINDLTGEGGRFFEMQELQSATLAGKISNLRDNYDMMLDSIGKTNRGLLHGAMDSIVELMDNWEKYWAILKGIIIAYGAYRAAVILSTLANNGLATAIRSTAAAQALFNSASKVNPYALVVAGIAAVVGLTISYASSQRELREELYRTIGGINDQADAVNSHIDRLKELTTRAIDDKDAQSERATIISKLSQTEPVLAAHIQEHSISLKELIKVQKEYNDLVDAKKLGEYMMSQGDSDGLREDLEDLTNAQNRLKVSVIGLEPVYAKLREEFEKVKQSGMFNGKSVGSDAISKIDEILTGEKNKAKAINDVYNYLGGLPAAGLWHNGIEDFTKDVFGRDFKSNMTEYGRGYRDLRTATDEAKKGLDSFAESMSIYLNNQGQGLNSLDLLKQRFEELSGISFKDFLGKDAHDQTQYLSEDVAKLYKDIQISEQRLRDLVGGISGLTKYGQEHILTKWDVSINGSQDVEARLDGWRKLIQDALGNTITIKVDDNINEISDEIKKKHNELKTRMDEQKPILIKYGFDFNSGEFPSPLEITSVMKQLGDSYKADSKDVENLLNAAKTLGKSASDLNTKKEKTVKDAFAEQLKKRIDLLKSAKTEYDKLVKAGMGEESAANKISGLDSFKGIDPRKYEADLDKIINDLQKKGTKISKEQGEILRGLVMNRDTDGLAKFAEQLVKDSKEAIDRVEKELSQYKDKYSLYEYIFGKTGDKGQAAKIAFGSVVESIMTEREAIQKALDATTNNDQKAKYQEQLDKYDATESANLAKKMTDLLVEYQTTEEKITAIKAIGEKQRQEILTNALNLNKEEVSKLLQFNQESINKQVADLTSGILQATNSYQRLFTDISDLSTRELQYLIDKFKNAIANATKNADGSMTISMDGKNIQTTEKEIASLTKRVLKSEKDIRDRNPFKALLGSIKELHSNRNKIKEVEDSIAKLEKLRAAAERDKANGNGDVNTDNIITSTSKQISELNEEKEDLAAQTSTSLKKIGADLANFADKIVAVSQSLSTMFDALGNESLSETIGLIGELAGSLSTLGEGVTTKDPVKIVQGIAGAITSIANYHDKKLDKAIRKSQLEVKKLQYAYSALEYTIENTYGEDKFKKAGELTSNLYLQQIQLQKQLQAEQNKKKKDKSAIEDYKNEIAEIERQVQEVSKKIRDEIVGSTTEWSNNLANALVDAFRSGENAAKAWGDNVDDIIANIIKNMLATKYLAPEIKKIIDDMWSEMTQSNEKQKTQLSKDIAWYEFVRDDNSKVSQIAKKNIEASGIPIDVYIEQYKKALEDLNNPSLSKEALAEAKERLKALGDQFAWIGGFLDELDLTNNKAKDTLSKGIQSITEDTASLLASYVNAMRADLAAQRQLVFQLVSLAQKDTFCFENMYAELLRIQVNTLNTANNTAKLVELSQNTNSILRQATIKGSGTMFNV